MLEKFRDACIAAMCCTLATIAVLLYLDARPVLAGLSADAQAIDTVAYDLHAQRPAIDLLMNRTIPGAIGNVNSMSKVVAQIGADERADFAAQQQSYLTTTQATTNFLTAGTGAMNELHEQIQLFGPVLTGMAATEKAATDDLSDPNIKISLASIARFTGNAEAATDHANDILADGKQVADRLTAEYLKPVTKTMRVLRATGQAVGSEAHSILFGGW